MKRRVQRGFSLLELVMAITIILIIAAISIPNLLRARQSAYEASAAGFLHTAQTEQIAYKAQNGSYASSFSQLPGIAALASSGTSSGSSGASGSDNSVVITDSGSGTGATSTIIRQSYIFTMTKTNDEQWQIWATPILDRTQGQYFYTDESGAVHSQKGAPPTTNSGYVQ